MDSLEIFVLLENSNIQYRLKTETSSKEPRERLQHHSQPTFKQSTKYILMIFMLLVNLLIFAVCGTILLTFIVSVSESFRICPSSQSACAVFSLNIFQKNLKKARYQGRVEKFVFQYFPEREHDLTRMNSTIRKLQTCFKGKPWFDDQEIQTRRATPSILPDFYRRSQVPFGLIEKNIGGPSPNIDFWKAYPVNERRKDSSCESVFCSTEQISNTRLNKYKNHITLCKLLKDLSLTREFRDHLWKYIKIAIDGGVSTANDTTDWWRVGKWYDEPPSPAVLSSIGMFVIFEPEDAGTPIQQDGTMPLSELEKSVIVAFGAVPGHPIVIDTIRSLVMMMGNAYPIRNEQTVGDWEAHFKQALLRYMSITIGAGFSSSDGVKTKGGSITIGDLVITPSKELVKGSGRHENLKMASQL